MNKKLAWITGIVAVFCTALAFGSSVQAEDNNGASSAVQPVADLPCQLEALPTLDNTLDRITDLLNRNPVTQPLANGVSAVTRTGAIDLARAVTDATGANAAAAKMSYSDAENAYGTTVGDASLVAPLRCVWVVTVAAPYAPRSAPEGIDATGISYDSYTVTLDVASGEVIDVGAGPETPNVITGVGFSN